MLFRVGVFVVSFASLIVSFSMSIARADTATSGVNSEGDTLPIGAGGVTVETVTGSTKAANFVGSVTAGSLTVGGSGYFGSNLGVGENPQATLDVNGGVRIGNDTRVCGGTSGAPAGTIRFNPTTKTFEGCDGTVWASLGGHTKVGTYQVVCDGTSTNQCYVINTATGTVTGQAQVFNTFAKGATTFTNTSMAGSTASSTSTLPAGTYQMTCDGSSGYNNCYVINTLDGTLYGQAQMFNTFANGGSSFTTTIAPK